MRENGLSMDLLVLDHQFRNRLVLDLLDNLLFLVLYSLSHRNGMTGLWRSHTLCFDNF